MYKSAAFINKFAFAGKNIQVFEHALILKPEVIEIHDNVRIDDFTRIEGGEGIVIGKGTHISSYASIFGGGIARLGVFVGISQGVKLITGTGHPFVHEFPFNIPYEDICSRKPGQIVIEDYAFIGTNAIIFPNVKISEGAVVGANSVVTKDVQPWSVVVGMPAKHVKFRNKFT